MDKSDKIHTPHRRRGALACWIEAMRLRTLPVSVAGVVMAGALGLGSFAFEPVPWLICLLFAILCQIASNFANEYFDYRDGLDKPGRVGPRRGVTEGDISPRAMLAAAIGTLAVAAALGCLLIFWGGWWLILAGIAIVAGALAYSTGPYPLSRHGWGEAAVIIFFGIAPVTLTFYCMSGGITQEVWLASLTMGLLGANVLVVNNYRDIDEDRNVGKLTLEVRFGPSMARRLYLFNGLLAITLMLPTWTRIGREWLLAPLVFLILHFALWRLLCRRTGKGHNPLLGATSMLMLLYSLVFLLAVITC